MALHTPDIEELARRFEWFVEETRDYSPLYVELAQGIMGDAELLGLLARARTGQRRPTLFMAAVNYLGGIGPFPQFRRFVLDNREAVLEVIETRATQTNEVGRCAVLVPILRHAVGDRPLALIEIGCSAGLNLLLDRYGYDFGGGHRLGAGPPVLSTDIPDRWAPSELPSIAWRIGIDREPVDVMNDDAVKWLRACIYADQPGRVQRLEAAVEVARSDPPTIVSGNVLDVLRDVVATAPADAHLVLLHTWVIAYLTRDQRAAFFDLVDSIGARRDLTWVSAEGQGIVAPLGLERAATTAVGAVTYANAQRDVTFLGTCHPHGAWFRPTV